MSAAGKSLPQQDAVAGSAVAIENEAGSSRFVLLCDHASNRIPQRWGTLGLDPDALKSHIAWDPGALDVARCLSALLDAPLLHATASRLVIDCNRPIDAPDAIPEISETIQIPGNLSLNADEKAERAACSHIPYHNAISDFLAERTSPVALVAIHTYTPVYKGVARPWPIGIIFNKDRRLADPLIAHLRRSGLNVGINEPYSPADRVYYTLERHGEAHNLPCVMVEIRNNEVTEPSRHKTWARLLADGLRLGEAMLPDGKAAGAA